MAEVAGGAACDDDGGYDHLGTGEPGEHFQIQVVVSTKR
jgi:hypothetical protein